MRAAVPGLATRATSVGGSPVREILALTARPEVISFAGGLPAPELFDAAAIRAAYDRVLADQGGTRATFAIEDLADGALVGFVHLFDIDWPCRLAHFGIVIGETGRQGRGLGSEATALMVGYGFDTLNLDRIELRVVDGNAPARHIYAKLGFVDEGRLRRAAFIAGAPADVIVMGLLREEFRKPG